MGRMSDARKAELQRKYGNDALTPLSQDYFEQARQKSARYILFVNRDNRHGYCEKCGSDVEFEKTKHKDKVECPNCKTKLTIQHTWRKATCEWNVDWYVVGQALDNETFALRYIRVGQSANYVKNISEAAREIYDFKHGWSYKFSNLTWEDGWKVNSRYYFTEFTMNWHRRKDCCIAATRINNVLTELKKIDALKYFDQLTEYFGTYLYSRDSVKCLLNGSLYEKLEKVGLGKLAREDFEDYNGKPIKFKRTETSLLKMLGINKAQYNLLRNFDSKKVLEFIKSDFLSMQDMEYVITHGAINAVKEIAKMKSVSKNKRMKALKYVNKNNLSIYEYSHYLYLMEKLHYTIDDSYLFPKDFRKADNRVSDEYQTMLDEEKAKGMSEQSKLIKKISDGLRKMPNLEEFLNGSRGLLVYVPESAKDLIKEGRVLHNCIGTYVDKIAENKTLVFFVRQLNSPDAPFVAFEYCNGEVVQCMYNHNERVKDDNIIDFVEAFAERLRQNEVMYKAA